VSVILWWGAEAFGMVLTGMATDFNSGLLLVVIALACWPRAHSQYAARERVVSDVKQSEGSSQLA